MVFVAVFFVVFDVVAFFVVGGVVLAAAVVGGAVVAPAAGVLTAAAPPATGTGAEPGLILACLQVSRRAIRMLWWQSSKTDTSAKSSARVRHLILIC